MTKKMLVEVGGWKNGFVILELIVAICSIFSEHHFVGGQTTNTIAPTIGAQTVVAVTTAAKNESVTTYLGEMCEKSSTCSAQVANSECKDAGDNSGSMRCRCLANFYPYNVNRSSNKEDFKCGKVLTNAINRNCQACEDNEGTCVADSASTTGVFCQCPISRSGDNCETIHVNVSCSMSAMKICYSPHVYVNFTDGWRMYTLNHRKLPQCGSATVYNHSDLLTPETCQDGNEELVLSLNQTDLSTCGTKSNEDAHNKIYNNKIEIQRFDSSDNMDTNSTTISFNVYCSFTAYQDQTFPGIGVGRVNGNDQGGQVNPNITFKVRNEFGRDIGRGVTLLVGDRVKFLIILTLDGNYESLQVQRVTASTSPIMPDSTAETRALMTGGCPIAGEVTGNSWYWTKQRVGNELNVQSGAVPIFKLSSSNNLYIHCALKLCMTGDTSCPTFSKQDCEGVTRRKRAVDSEVVAVEQHGRRRKREATNVNVQTGLRVEDPNSNSNPQTDPLPVGSPGFIALLVILALIAAVLIVVTIIVAVKTSRRRKSGTDQNYQPRPQLFALPRINRTHERF